MLDDSIPIWNTAKEGRPQGDIIMKQHSPMKQERKRDRQIGMEGVRGGERARESERKGERERESGRATERESDSARESVTTVSCVDAIQHSIPSSGACVCDRARGRL